MCKSSTITPQEAVDRLREAGMKIGPQTLREGILQRVFPFGDAVEMEDPVFWIYPRKLEAWIEENLS